MFNGSYSDLRLWNGALTSAQVASSYSAGPNIIVGPALNIVNSGRNITIQWPANATTFTLQSATSLKGGAWTPVVGTPTVVNGFNVLTVTPSSQSQTYYRLMH